MVNKKLEELAIKALVIAQNEDDPEEGHPLADKALCDLLVNLGYSKVVHAFNLVHKWYA